MTNQGTNSKRVNKQLIYGNTPFYGTRKNTYQESNTVHPYITVYLPENLDIDLLLQDYPLPKGIGHLKNPHLVTDKIKVVLGSIYNVFIGSKDHNGEWVKLNSEVLKSIDNDSKKILDWALTANIIETDGSFKEGSHSCSYRFSPLFKAKTKSYTIYNPVLVSKYKKYAICEDTVKKHPQLFQDLKRTSIDMRGVQASLKKLYNDTFAKIVEDNIKWWRKQKFTPKQIRRTAEKLTAIKQESRYLGARRLSIKDWKFKRDKTSTRLHTNITGLKKELRKHILIDGKKQQLINLDFKNSQPFFLNTVLDADCWDKLGLMNKILKLNTGLCLNYSKHHPNHLIPNPELIPITLRDIWTKKYSQTVQDYKKTAQAGKVYEFVYELINGEKIADLPKSERKDARNSVKDLMLKVLFSPTNFNKGNKVYQQFKKCFPELTDIIEWINTGFNKTRNGVKKKDGEVVNKRGEDDQRNALAILSRLI